MSGSGFPSNATTMTHEGACVALDGNPEPVIMDVIIVTYSAAEIDWSAWRRSTGRTAGVLLPGDSMHFLLLHSIQNPPSLLSSRYRGVDGGFYPQG
jgi:hypothetical protein